MQRCLQLAALGAGRVSPNPLVGSVLVYDERIIGEGYHRQYGTAHAEVNCLLSVNEADKHLIPGSSLYVSLEPCDHYGNTPPCTDLILKQGIKKVVIGCRDISARVNGKGVQKLHDNGVEVTENILEQDCIALNHRFFTFHKFDRPYVILKWAQTADGFIGRKGEKTKISSQMTDRIVHRWRAEEDAIIVGYRTVLTDDPQLNVRYYPGPDPLRVVYDPLLKLPATLKFFDQRQSTVVFNDQENKTLGNITYIRLDKKDDIRELLEHLFKIDIQSLIVEGGAALLQKFMNSGLWDEARIITTNAKLGSGVNAPDLPDAELLDEYLCANDTIRCFTNNSTGAN